jgi:hypothetical protein
MNVSEAQKKISNIEDDITTINLLLRDSSNLDDFYKQTLHRTVKNLESYKQCLLNAIENADIGM